MMRNRSPCATDAKSGEKAPWYYFGLKKKTAEESPSAPMADEASGPSKMGKELPLEKAMSAQWYGTKLPAPSAKKVEEKVTEVIDEVSKTVEKVTPEPAPEANGISHDAEQPAAEAAPKTEPESESPGGKGLFAKLGIPLAAVVLVAAVVAKAIA